MIKTYTDTNGVKHYNKPRVIRYNGLQYCPPTDEQLEIAGWIISEEETTHKQTQEEIDRQNKLNRIFELKNLLQESDYKAIKFLEGELSGEEYEPVKIQRRLWREEINNIESEI